MQPIDLQHLPSRDELPGSDDTPVDSIERQQKERLAARLRALGEDPDTLL